MKFGLGQIGKPTPQTISTVKRSLNFFIAGVVTFFPFVSKITGIAMDDLSQIVGLFALMVNSLGIMFGISPEEAKAEIDSNANKGNSPVMGTTNPGDDKPRPDKP